MRYKNIHIYPIKRGKIFHVPAYLLIELIINCLMREEAPVLQAKQQDKGSRGRGATISPCSEPTSRIASAQDLVKQPGRASCLELWDIHRESDHNRTTVSINFHSYIRAHVLLASTHWCSHACSIALNVYTFECILARIVYFARACSDVVYTL